MANNSLQKKLGLGLAQAQTANMNAQTYNIANASQPGRFQIEGGSAVGSQGAIGAQALSPVSLSTQSGSTTPINQVSTAQTFNQATESVSAPQAFTNNTVDTPIVGITNKKKNIAETTGQIAPVTPIIQPIAQPDMSGFREATMGQDVQFRQSYRDALQNKAVAPTNTPTTTPFGLSGAELQAYNQLSPQEQKQYQALATQGMKAQTDYLAKSKANMEFQKSQEENRLAQEKSSIALADMQSQETIANAQKQVANLKQNIGYLGSGGQPGVSAQKLDAVSNQVTLADRTLKNIQEADRLSKENRALGQERNAEIFTRQIKILQDDLDSKVNKTVQSALNEFTSAELEGKLDTIEEIEAFQQQLYAQLDGDLSSILDTNIEARQFLIERYDKLAESQKTQMLAQQKAEEENRVRSMTLNKDMSEALGYYVNENGEALKDRITGQNIVVPPESDVTYDKDSGQMVILTKNRDGSVDVQLKQVGTPKATAPKWERDPTTGGYYDANSNINPTSQMAGTPQGLLDYISASEGTHGNYNAMYGKGGQTEIPLTQMTIKDIQDLQRKSIYKDRNGNYVGGAMGKYQIVSGTLQGLINRGVVKPTDMFDEATQDRMAMSLLGNSYADYQAGKITADQLQNKVSGIWAGVPNTKGVSTYASDRTNKARADNGAFLKAIGTQGVGVSTGGLTDDVNVKVANIGNIAFGRTMSDTEGKRVESIIKNYPNASVNDIALAVRGLNIKNEEDKPLALEYVNIFDKMSDSVKPKTGLEMTISKYINSGDYKGLNNFVEKNVDRQVKADEKDDATTTADLKWANDITNKLVGFIEKNKDKIGAFDGTINNWIAKFGDNKEFTQIKANLQQLQAQTRRAFAGSAVTETEMVALRDFIGGKETMDADNLITQLKEVQANNNAKYKAQREGYQIPNVGTVQAKKKLGGFSLTDILSKLP